jgi:type VI protein secretion system component Hcp
MDFYCKRPNTLGNMSLQFVKTDHKLNMDHFYTVNLTNLKLRNLNESTKLKTTLLFTCHIGTNPTLTICQQNAN